MNTSPTARRGIPGKSPFLAAILSLIPGVGHLYLGLATKGLALLTITLGGFVLMVVAPMVASMGPRPEAMVSVVVYFLLIAPVCLFYSMFDAYHIAKGSPVEDLPLGRKKPATDTSAGAATGAAAVESAGEQADPAYLEYCCAVNNQRSLTWGVILTLTGLLSLGWTVGGYRMTYLLRLWPLVLVALGLVILAGNLRRSRDARF